MMHTPSDKIDSAHVAVASVVIPHYNSSSVLVQTVASVLAAAREEQVPVEIVVADDGSAQQHHDALFQLRDQGVTVVFGGRNAGRSAAVNLGATHATCELLLVLDCDCRPGSGRFFRSHLDAIAEADASFGGLATIGRGFWTRYQELAALRRLNQFAAGVPYALTTHNLMLRKHVFLSVGGYDTTYTRYGFEDRDLLIRLRGAGARFALAIDSDVLHCDDHLSLTTVARKMFEAAGYSAGIFRTRHPEAYRALGYARLDATERPLLRPIGKVGGPVALWLAPRIDPWLERLPFSLGLWAARVIAALSYVGGSVGWRASGGDRGGHRT